MFIKKNYIHINIKLQIYQYIHILYIVITLHLLYYY